MNKLWLLLLCSPVSADMIVELQGPEVITEEFMLTGTVTNTGDEILDRFGAQAFASSGYVFNWAPNFNEQFGVLLPGESLDFDFAWLRLTGEQTTHNAWLELQSGGMSERAEITWTSEVMGESRVMGLRADIQGAEIKAVTVPEGPMPLWLLVPLAILLWRA